MWYIKQILEADFGCEERAPGEKLKCLVYIENESGEKNSWKLKMNGLQLII